MKLLCLIALLSITVLAQGQENWLINDPNGFDYFITTEINKGKIVGMTRKNALKDIVGRFKFSMAKMATSVKYPEIVHFEGSSEGEKYKGKFHKVFSQLKFEAEIKDDSIHITLINDKNFRSQISGAKVNKIIPVRNYKNIFEKLFDLTEKNIYNQSFLKTKTWKNFKKRMLKISNDVKDDLELQIAFYAHVRNFPFSHYHLYETLPEKNKEKEYSGFAELNEIDNLTCVLKIKGFYGTKQEMDSLITVIQTKQYQNLIIDLRDNYGGTLESAFPLGEFIIDEPIISGVFPNKNWYHEYDRLPLKNDYSNFSEFTGGTLEEWYKASSKNYGAYFKVLPSENNFKGNVYILTNNSTASTCEPFVNGLKEHNYATIIGEHTAGAMLSANQYQLTDNITVTIPLNDYVTYSGKRIDKMGVKPHVEVESEKALEFTLEEITVGNNVYKK